MIFKIGDIVKIREKYKSSVYWNNGGDTYFKGNLDDIFKIIKISRFIHIQSINVNDNTQAVIDYEIYEYGRVLKINKLMSV